MPVQRKPAFVFYSNGDSISQRVLEILENPKNGCLRKVFIIKNESDFLDKNVRGGVVFPTIELLNATGPLRRFIKRQEVVKTVQKLEKQLRAGCQCAKKRAVA